jgi:hypothetical protein
MKLEIYYPEVLKFWGNSCYEIQAGNWIKLTNLPSEMSHDEALLLCQKSAHEWIVWIPDYGESLHFIKKRF